MNQDAFNFQYILYTCRMGYADDTVDYFIRLWPFREPKGFMTSTLPVESFDTDRDVFLGRYRSESNPESVERGRCSNSIALGRHPLRLAAQHNPTRTGRKEVRRVRGGRRRREDRRTGQKEEVLGQGQCGRRASQSRELLVRANGVNTVARRHPAK